MIIAIDFDGTIVKTKVDERKIVIKRNKLLAKKIINKLYNDHTIIINTLRVDKGKRKYLSEAKKWLKKEGIKYHYINENSKEVVEGYWGDTRKIAADIYIDDKNIISLVSWPIIYLIIKLKLWLRKN